MKSELAHHGVKGMRWGVRNDPVRTGPRRLKKAAITTYHTVRKAGSAVRSFKNRRAIKSGNRKRIYKRLNKMSNAELAEVITKMDLQNHAMSSLTNNSGGSGKNNRGEGVVTQILKSAAKQQVQNVVNNAVASALRGENPVDSFVQDAQTRSNQNEIRYLQSEKQRKALRYDLGMDSKVSEIKTNRYRLAKTRRLKHSELEQKKKRTVPSRCKRNAMGCEE